MGESDNGSFSSPRYWSQKWLRHLADYRRAPPRFGIWLKSRYGGRGLQILECAAGSCSDSIYLAARGERVTASDFDEVTLSSVAQEEHPNLVVEVHEGFAMNLPDESFDLVFHNGFWVCFESNEEIQRLMREQLRVARFALVASVHNAENRKLRKSFTVRAIDDDLYNIRFFSRSELLSIVQCSLPSKCSVRFWKFGGEVDRLYSIARRLPFLASATEFLVPRLYRLLPWSMVERIVLEVRRE